MIPVTSLIVSIKLAGAGFFAEPNRHSQYFDKTC